MNWLSIPKTVYGAICRYIERKKIPPKGSQMPEAPATGQLKTNEPRFKPNWLIWPVERSSRTFRVYVVEPHEYNPRDHAAIFKGALSSLVNSERSRVDPYVAAPAIETVEPFDLITFPEAFLPIDDFLSVLVQISCLAALGCVHVGLRPTVDGKQHLFKVNALKDFIISLSAVPNISTKDLAPFSDWLSVQSDEDLFNIGCIFTIDAHQSVRVCLHPKLVRSQFETSPFSDAHMKEANLLTLVTLQPENRALLSITIQPLICSDALFLDTDMPNNRPLEAVNSNANCFEISPPDHIDIVSVATCTPHPEHNNAEYRQWHQQFLDSFISAPRDAELARHHHSIFVLSNYGIFPKNVPAGLSGAFLPIPLRDFEVPSFVSISAWGHPKQSKLKNNWSSLAGDPPLGKDWSSLGYIASLDPYRKNSLALACMFGFTIHRLPRNATRWQSKNGLDKYQLRIATFNAETGDVEFRKEDLNA